jgi:uncharacterized protein
MRPVLNVLPTLLLMLAGCGGSSDPVEEFQTTPLTLPHGQRIRVETMTKREDMMKGMMFRDSMREDRGMLFVHGSPGLYPYWMYQMKIPLDMLWLDLNKRVVEISANTPACTGAASTCPNYGGHKPAVFVLELKAGAAKKFGINVGDQMQF